MINIQTKRFNSPPLPHKGSAKYVLLEHHRPDGTTVPVFGMRYREVRGSRFYESDTHCKQFDSLTEAKEFAKEIVRKRDKERSQKPNLSKI